MLGAIIGDMVGSIYEFNPIKTKDFNIYNPEMRMTDDSYLTMAVAKALLKQYPFFGNLCDPTEKEAIQKDLRKEFLKAFHEHPTAGYGGMFYMWCKECEEKGEVVPAYNSYGNGSAMRISPVGWIADTQNEVKILSKLVTEITHNHPEGLKGAEAIAMAVYLAKEKYTKEEIKQIMIHDYYPEIANFDFDDLVKNYEFSEICQKSVPQAIYCFLISNSLEDAIRNCIAIGGDCDTTACMAGAIAEAFYNRDSVSKFEETFMYLKFDKEDEEFIKKFYKIVNVNKWLALEDFNKIEPLKRPISYYLDPRIYNPLVYVLEEKLGVKTIQELIDQDEDLVNEAIKYIPEDLSQDYIADFLEKLNDIRGNLVEMVELNPDFKK